jgi:glycosyltransferase involved in cell wall biosynthesis
MSDLISMGYNISAVASKEGHWQRLNDLDSLRCIRIDIARAPSPFKDLVSVYKLFKLFLGNNFDVVHSTTPKAGLVCALASILARTPVRMHTFTGQTWATKVGLSRYFLSLIDRLIVRLNTQCYADSESQRDFLVEHGVGSKASIKVLGSGSLAGVDLARFDQSLWDDEQRSILQELGFTKDDWVITFIGRVSGDKGIYELIEAFLELKKEQKFSHVKLVVIGPCEESEVSNKLLEWQKIKGFKYIGETYYPEKYLSVSKLLCLPSYREGFGTVVIEAAAIKVPTLGTKIIGLKDAIVDGVTGLIVEPKDSVALKEAMSRLVLDDLLVQQMSEAAYLRCRNSFDSSVMSQLVAHEYETSYEEYKHK